MYDNDTRGFENPGRDGESFDNNGTCPHCKTLILALVARGPSDHVLSPCGCRVTETTARDLAGGADRGRGVATDGGQSTSGTNQSVVHADAFEALGDLPDDHAHAAVVDYPWEFDYENGTNRMGYDRKEHAEDGETPMFEMAEDEVLSVLLAELERVLVDGAWLFCFADDRFQDVVRDSLRDADQFVFRRNWAWTPNRMGMGYYGRVSHYPIPAATNGETERYVQDRGTLVSVDGRAESEYSTAKPVGL
jgi:hypothetical protein